VKRRDFERWLRDNNAYLERHGSRHDVWRRGAFTASVPRHSDIAQGTARAICKHLRVPEKP
jgi:HicA toxin of bacterial toxin-antitoxin,